MAKHIQLRRQPRPGQYVLAWAQAAITAGYCPVRDDAPIQRLLDQARQLLLKPPYL